MLNDEMYNRICNLFFCEEVRRKNTVVDLLNMIQVYAVKDPVVFVKLAQAQAVADYFDYFCGSFLDWLGGFVED